MARIPHSRIDAHGPPAIRTQPRLGVVKSATARTAPEQAVRVPTLAFDPPPTESPRQEAERRAREEVEAKVRAALDRQEREFTARLERRVREAHEDGRRQGVREGRQSAMDEMADERSRLIETGRRLADSARDLARRSEPVLADIAFAMAEAVVGAPLPAGTRKVSEAVLAATIEKLSDAQHLRLTLHPVDMMALQESGIAELLSANHPSLQWHPDPSVAPGDWEASTNRTLVRHMAGEMLTGLRARLAASAASDIPPAD